MKTLALACAFTLAFAGAAMAGTMENSFGNTFTVTPAGGPAIAYHFNADHSFMMIIGETRVSGAWEIANGQICLTPQGGERQCSDYESSKNVGDTWVIDYNGSQSTVALTAGRH